MFLPTEESPAKRDSREIKESGIVGTIAKTALTFIGYGIGMKVFRGLSFRANVGIGRFVTKLATPGTALSKSVDRAFTQIKSKAVTQAERQGIERLSAIRRKATRVVRESVRSVDSSLEEAVKPLVNRGRYSAQVTRRAIDRSEAQFMGLPRRAQSEFLRTGPRGALKDIRATTIVSNMKLFKDTGFGKFLRRASADSHYAATKANTGMLSLLAGRVKGTKGLHNVDIARAIRGKAYGYVSDIASIAAFDYAAYNLLMPSDKKWYNPKKVGEWAAFTVTTDLAFRTAIPQAKAIMGAAGKGVSRVLKTDGIGKRFMESVLTRAHKISTSGHTQAFRDAFDKAELRNKSGSSTMQFLRKIKAGVEDMPRMRQEILKQNKEINRPDMYEEMFDHLRQIDSQLGAGKRKPVRQAAFDTIESVKTAKDPNAWVGVVNKLFGTNIRSATRQIGSNGVTKEVYKGSGFLSMDGKNYDIQKVTPSYLMSKVAGFAHDNFKISVPGIGSFQPLSIFGFKPFLNANEVKNKYALYTVKNSSGFVDIGPGLNTNSLEVVKNRVRLDKAKRMEKISVMDDPHLEKIIQNEEEVFQGKMGTLEDREYIRRLRKQERDINNVSEMHEAIFTARKNAGATEKELMTVNENLKRGYLKLRDEEFVQFAGDKAFFGIRDGGSKQFKVFQLGYDVDKGVYHRMSQIDAAEGGNIARLFAQVRGYNKINMVDDSGRPIKVGAGSSATRMRDRVDPEGSPLSQVTMGVLDWLELGNKQQRSVVGGAISYLTKWFHPKTLRNINSKIQSEGMLMMDQMSKSDLHTFIGRMDSTMRQANEALAGGPMRHASFIETMIGHSKSFSATKTDPSNPLAPIFDMFKTGTVFAKDYGLMPKEFNTLIKKNAITMRNNLGSLYSAANPELAGEVGAQFFGRADAEFLDRLIHSSNPFDFMKGQYGKAQLTNKDAYNNLVFRTYFNAIDHAKKDDLITTLKNIPISQRARKELDMLDIMGTINTYQGLDTGKLSIQQLKMLGTDTIKSIRRAPGSVNRMVEKFESLWKPTSLQDNIMYPNTGYTPANVAISHNKSLEGNTIYTLGEQLMGSAAGAIGRNDHIAQTTFSSITMQALNAVNNTGNLLGIGFQPDSVRTVGTFAKALAFKRILPAMALANAYNAADAFFDESGLFEGTQLGEGLNVLGASIVAQGRLAIAGINDSIGVTAASKYLEDIMPGSVNSPLAHAVRGFGGPVAGMGLGFKFGGPTGALIGGSIGATMSLLSSGGPMGIIGKFDITKSRTQLIEEYSGRKQVPVYKGAGWLFGAGPAEGMKIESFEPSWFHKMQSQYRHTDVLYGSKVERMLAPFDWNHYSEKHKYTRPYPVSERIFGNTPMVGNIIGMGGGITDQEELKLASYSAALNGGPEQGNFTNFVDSTPSSPYALPRGPAGEMVGTNALNVYNQQQGGFGGGQMGPNAVLPGSFIGRFNSAFSQTTDLLGLRGFVAETAITGMNDGLMPFEDVPKLESATWMTSPFRTYWDANMGDMWGLNELVRRFIPKHGQHINDLNPLINAMPGWIAGSNNLKDFGKGDPYTKVARGEIRLPGQGYEAVHNVQFRFPLETEYLGRTYEDQIGTLTGNALPSKDEKFDKMMSGPMAQRIYEQLSQSNANVQEGRMVYDPRLDLSGRADLFVNGSPVKTKVVSDETFKNLTAGVLPNHAAEMNAIINMSNTRTGSIVYMNAETGETKDHQIVGDQSKYYRDVQQLMAAKATSQEIVAKQGPNVGMNMANAYSRVDRLRILADVSPYSQQYQDTLRQVRTMNSFGKLSPQEQREVKTIVEQREQVMQRYITTDYKFMRGTAITPEEKDYQDQVKSQYNMVERTLGSAWEGFAHMQTPIHTKLLNVASPLEQYERMEVYGKPVRDWAHPYESFIRPWTTSALSRTDPVHGAMSFGMGGLIFGGPVGGAVAATVGGIYGTVNSAAGYGQVPGYRQEEREINEKVDRIRYEKAAAMFNATGSVSAKREMERTMTYATLQGATVRSMYSALPRHEKGFIRHFAEMGTAEERARLMEIAPNYLQPTLDKVWNGTRFDPKDPNLDFAFGQTLPAPAWSGWNANVSADDIAIKMYERAGIDAHENGLGWNNQIRRLRYRPETPETFVETNPDQRNIAQDVQDILESMIPGSQVSVIPTSTPGINVTVAEQV